MNGFLIKEIAADCQTQREPRRPWRGFFPLKGKDIEAKGSNFNRS